MRTPSSLRIAVLVLSFAVIPGPGFAARTLDASGPESLRIGITFGGVSFVGFVTEYRCGDRSVELTLGTWAFRDLSVSLVGKQYFGPGDFRPFSGLGVWAVVTPYEGAREQTGLAFLLRAPIGADWNLDADHHLGAALSLNRALWIRRKDPMDDTPPAPRTIPLPGFYYRWKR